MGPKRTNAKLSLCSGNLPNREAVHPSGNRADVGGVAARARGASVRVQTAKKADGMTREVGRSGCTVRYTSQDRSRGFVTLLTQPFVKGLVCGGSVVDVWNLCFARVFAPSSLQVKSTRTSFRCVRQKNVLSFALLTRPGIKQLHTLYRKLPLRA